MRFLAPRETAVTVNFVSRCSVVRHFNFQVAFVFFFSRKSRLVNYFVEKSNDLSQIVAQPFRLRCSLFLCGVTFYCLSRLYKLDRTDAEFYLGLRSYVYTFPFYTAAHWRRHLWGTGARAPSTSNNLSFFLFT